MKERITIVAAAAISGAGVAYGIAAYYPEIVFAIVAYWGVAYWILRDSESTDQERVEQ